MLIIGAGGLGAPAAMYLAAAGVGTIGIVDADEVDLSNLQRQIIHGTADVGKAKVKSAKETINAMNPDVNVITYREFVTSENIMDLIKDYDFIIDGTDNFPAKFLINDACVMAKKPFSHAGIIRFKGQLMTYNKGSTISSNNPVTASMMTFVDDVYSPRFTVPWALFGIFLPYISVCISPENFAPAAFFLRLSISYPTVMTI